MSPWFLVISVHVYLNNINYRLGFIQFCTFYKCMLTVVRTTEVTRWNIYTDHIVTIVHVLVNAGDQFWWCIFTGSLQGKYCFRAL